MKFLKFTVIKLIDIFLSPVTYLSALWLKQIRKKGLDKFTISRKIFEKVGVLPVIDHYYEPFFSKKGYIRKKLELPGVNLNIDEQLNLLKEFNFNDELLKIPMEKNNPLEYYYNNESFGSGDAEILYNLIRLKKPGKIIEIGSGNSTLMAMKAISKNIEENPDYFCEQICIEPFEMKWLESLPIKIIRQKVETLDKNIFTNLGKNDILFIDSSHVIRPQGDVLFEYMEILPILQSGVLIHIHDIFIPYDYPYEWLFKKVKLFNEQYLLEAFLAHNNSYEVIAALNYLKNEYPRELYEVCPVLKNQSERNPGSFWIQKK